MVELGSDGSDAGRNASDLGDDGQDFDAEGGGVSRDTADWRASWQTLCESILARQAKRLTKQAEREAATPDTFAAWLESLEIDRDTPADCVPAAQRLVATLRLRWSSTAMLALGQPDGQLGQAVAAITGELQTELPAAIAAEAAKNVLSK
jgi:hypothetical protein